MSLYFALYLFVLITGCINITLGVIVKHTHLFLSGIFCFSVGLVNLIFVMVGAF